MTFTFFMMTSVIGMPSTSAIFVQPYDDEFHGELVDLIERDEPLTYLLAVSREHPTFEAQAVVSGEGRVRAWMDDLMIDEALRGVRERSLAEGSCIVEALGARVFAWRFEPRPTIVCVGAGHITAALIPLAKTLGYRTVVVDPRRAFATEDRFAAADRVCVSWPQEALPALGLSAKTAVCALSHDEKIDVPALACGLDSPAFYLGCLGRPETLLDRRRALAELGISDESQLARIRGPIGLYIGGREPEDIALSILAQIAAVRSGRIHHAAEMPGHVLADFTEESVAAIARERARRRAEQEAQPCA